MLETIPILANDFIHEEVPRERGSSGTCLDVLDTAMNATKRLGNLRRRLLQVPFRTFTHVFIEERGRTIELFGRPLIELKRSDFTHAREDLHTHMVRTGNPKIQLMGNARETKDFGLVSEVQTDETLAVQISKEKLDGELEQLLEFFFRLLKLKEKLLPSAPLPFFGRLRVVGVDSSFR